MQNIRIFLAFPILGSVLVGNVLTMSTASTMNTTTTTVSTTTTTMAPATLDQVYADLPETIKTILMKYKDQTTTIDYAAFLAELKADAGYDTLKEKLNMQDITADSLKTVFEAYVNKDNPGNSGMRSGVTIGSVVMVTVMTMLMPFLN